MPTMESEILTLSEVASYLKIAEKTVLRMISRDEIPCAKVANQWRFMKTLIDDWLLARMNVIPQNDLAGILSNPQGMIPLNRLIDIKKVVGNLAPAPKKEILQRLVAPLVEQGYVEDGESFLKKLLLREKMTSTALGRGMAIPHLRHPKENPGAGAHLVMGICPEGTDFESHDGKKTHVFFLLLSDSETLHLRVLAKLNQLFRDESLAVKMTAVSAEKALEILFDSEKNLSTSLN